ncbi:MAG: adenosylcobalamin-dependent ribonucleoside-diphosphate reductase, partial [Bacteroidia bacterium]|nr:adenosylcobalamin-dependent ribonucleoside-diphosphate reductase [Bacteroidia bacterium]
MNALSPNALQILKSRYLLRDTGHKIIESPDQLFERVAKAVAKAESKWGDLKTVVHWGERFLEIMSNLEFLPNSPTLMNAGTTKGQLSACFVLPIDDNLFSIFTTLRDTALIHQSGGGTGFNFSNLRPHGDIVSSSSGVSSGPISFIRIFDVATEEIKQGGKRRGANMGILDINHPDIEDFIQCKSDGKSLRNFNLSIGLSDAFMHCLKNNGQWQLINPRTGKITRSLKAKFLWRKIAEEAWKTGDPGLIFTDNINAHNPTPTIADIEATNPCGEMPLLNYESCNLGSINLSRMITNGASGPEPDWDKIASTVHTGIRFLDDVVEVNHYPLEMIAKMTRANRKIGLGVMGWAEMLIALEIPYASDEAVQLGGQIMQFVQEQSNQSSKALAKERGAFPNWEKSIYNKGEPYRNATRTAIAPTGTISIIAGTSSSIEPLYGLYHRRRKILSNKSL